jgi:hypothetical protein
LRIGNTEEYSPKIKKYSALAQTASIVFFRSTPSSWFLLSFDQSLHEQTHPCDMLAVIVRDFRGGRRKG